MKFTLIQSSTTICFIQFIRYVSAASLLYLHMKTVTLPSVKQIYFLVSSQAWLHCRAGTAKKFHILIIAERTHTRIDVLSPIGYVAQHFYITPISWSVRWETNFIITKFSPVPWHIFPSFQKTCTFIFKQLSHNKIHFDLYLKLEHAWVLTAIRPTACKSISFREVFYEFKIILFHLFWNFCCCYLFSFLEIILGCIT